MKNYLDKIQNLEGLDKLITNYDLNPEDTMRSLLDIVTDEEKVEELKALIIGIRGVNTSPIAINKGREFLANYVGFVLDKLILENVEVSEVELFGKLNELDKKAKETKDLILIDELMLRQKHFNRDKLAKDFMARKTLSYIKEVSGGEHDVSYLPKLLIAMSKIKDISYSSLKEAIENYSKRTIYLTSNKKYVKTGEYLTEELPLVEARFDSSDLKAYISSLTDVDDYVECNTKEDIISVLNSVIKLFNNIDKTIDDINSKTTNEISEYKSLNFLEANVKDLKAVVQSYIDKEVTTEQFELTYKNMVNITKNSLVSRVNVYNQALDIVEESFLRYDYILDIYSVLNNMINNGKLGDPIKD